ncbi:hypothetical protein LC087_18960 (plasmid) [Bacillus carboniphilus]|uniref:Lipoprotein n=1 Tax=Bacillus carboniphilus TaxID=86663 RepID=A0ABY9JY98_9BACI|nr:hypothetical protein [Bacillus carboniphilus]WLR44391.1 hypothetical protein LC087_18960 [Bacillus carboniphilus]
MKRFLILTVIVILISGCQNEQESVKNKVQDKGPSDIDVTERTVKSEKIVDNKTEYILPYKNIINGFFYNNIYYGSFEKENGEVCLIGFNVKTKEEELIYKSEFKESALQNVLSNENALVFLDSTVDGYYTKLYAYNKETKEKSQLTESDSDYLTLDIPTLYNEYVSWVYLDTSQGGGKEKAIVQLHNLNSKETIDVDTINEFGMHNVFVSMDDNKLVWTDTVNDKGVYKVYDLHSKKISIFDSPFKYPGYSKIDNDKIYAFHFNDKSDWINKEFGYFDINKKEYSPFFSKEKNEYLDYFAVNNQNVTITTDENHIKTFLSNDQLPSKDIEVENTDIIEQPAYNQDGDMFYVYRNEKEETVLVVVNK